MNMDDTGSTQSQDIDYLEKQFEKALDLHDTGKFDQAASLYQNLLEINSLNSLLLNSYGTLLYQQGNLSDGRAIYRKIHHSNPNASIFFNRMGVVKRTQGDIVSRSQNV